MVAYRSPAPIVVPTSPNGKTGARISQASELADAFRATRSLGHIFGAHLGPKNRADRSNFDPTAERVGEGPWKTFDPWSWSSASSVSAQPRSTACCSAGRIAFGIVPGAIFVRGARLWCTPRTEREVIRGQELGSFRLFIKIWRNPNREILVSGL